MRNTLLTPKQPPHLIKPPQTLPNPLAVASTSWKALATIKSHLFPSSWAQQPLKPVCLAIARLRPNESTALAMKGSHLFPRWWGNPRKTSVFGNSAASTYWKHSSCNEREPPLPKMMSQPTKKHLKPVCLAIARLRPMKAQLLKWKRATSSQDDEPTHKKRLKPVCLAIVRLRPTESIALAMIEGAFKMPS